MKHLIIFDSQNTVLGTLLPKGSRMLKKDGDEFGRMAGRYSAWAQKKGDSVIVFDVHTNADGTKNKSALKKRKNLFAFLEDLFYEGDLFNRIAFFMHGSPKHLNRHMVSIPRGNSAKFCLRIRRLVHSNGTKIFLFCCKTAKLEKTGFAFELSDKTYTTVIGHKTSGHTVRNPNKRKFKPFGKWNDLHPQKRTKAWKLWVEKNKDPESVFCIVEGA